MRSAKDFFQPLALGAPEPLREIPFKPSRMIHFFDPSNPKMAAKVPDIAKKCDVMLGNLEDAVAADKKIDAREGLVSIGRETDFGTCQLWTRINSLDSPWIMLLDPRSDFYAMHPELKPMTFFCSLRATSKELNAFAWLSVEECLVMLSLHKKGDPLPPPRKILPVIEQEDGRICHVGAVDASDGMGSYWRSGPWSRVPTNGARC